MMLNNTMSISKWVPMPTPIVLSVPTLNVVKQALLQTLNTLQQQGIIKPFGEPSFSEHSMHYSGYLLQGDPNALCLCHSNFIKHKIALDDSLPNNILCTKKTYRVVASKQQDEDLIESLRNLDMLESTQVLILVNRTDVIEGIEGIEEARSVFNIPKEFPQIPTENYTVLHYNPDQEQLVAYKQMTLMSDIEDIRIAALEGE